MNAQALSGTSVHRLCRKTVLKKFGSGGLLLLLLSISAFADTHYVSLSGSHTAPYTTWMTAATNIQAAIDAASAGDTVLVSNGVYATGGRVVYGALTNRIAITKPVTVRSVSGPAMTIIQGAGPMGDSAVRCAYVGINAALEGFTLINGATRSSGYYYHEQSGGGVWCESSGVLSNCVLTANSASYAGGGAYDGTLYNCTLSGNSASVDGGGAYNGTLYNCTLTGNMASDGGGAIYSTLYNCTLSDNSASRGGGTYNSTLYNCMLTGNSAYSDGGGAFYGTLWNCTVSGNSASRGGGTYDSILYNGIVYYNEAAGGANYYGSNLNYSCTTPYPGGSGNITNEPQLASFSHLTMNSPCRGAGHSDYARGTDIDGEVWRVPPSMGCDEVVAGAITGLLSVSASAAFTNVAVGFPIRFRGNILGRTTGSVWDFGDGTVLSNKPYATHAYALPGVYAVVLRAYNESYLQGITATVTVSVATQVIHYVKLGDATALAPYTSWATAAANIQDAIDASSQVGALVLVSNGTYATGGRVVYGALTNRVVITKPVTVRSVHGPVTTIIQGAGPAGDSAVRCAYVGANAVLEGFTLISGTTRSSGDYSREQSGGGVWCESSGVLSNCVLTANSAFFGGGVYGGALYNCTLTGNSASNVGGGTSYGMLYNCILTGNSASYQGGGVSYSTLYNCTLTSNSASHGGGVYHSTLYNCTLVGNSAYAGGGVSGGALYNCMLTGNSASDYGGGAAYGGMLYNCMLTSNSSSSGGGVYGGTLYNCTFTGNSAYDGGGAYYGTFHNCTFTGNLAYVGGGGAYYGTLYNCALIGNLADYGGGAYGDTLYNCTLSGNSADYGGGAYYGILYNCIVYHNTALSYSNCLGSTLTYSCTTPDPGGIGNITNDPRFVNAGAGDYHLQATSPCIDAGTNQAWMIGATDLDGNPRLDASGRVDMGAYEYQGLILSTIVVTPVNPCVLMGASQQFTATATYTDGSTQDITSQSTWTSSDPGVATIDARGLATLISVGFTTISATLSDVVGATTLTVNTPLLITPTLFPTGFMNVFYTGTLCAMGGTPPYIWSIAGGSLPAGLTLHSGSGVINGTPTISGTFSFTVQVSDACSQTTNNVFSITVAPLSTGMTIWSNTTAPVMVDVGPDSAVELGVKFRSDMVGTIAGIRFYKAAANTGTHLGNLWTSNGTRLATVTFSNETASGWQQALFDTPVAIASNTIYVASYHADNGHYSEDDYYFLGRGVDNPPLHALADGVAGGNSVYAYGTNSLFPSQTWHAANYWVDVVFQAGSPPVPVITTTTLSPGVIHVAYTATLTAANGTLPYTWSIIHGSLPLGLTLNSGSGAISGTPSVPGIFNFTVQVRDSGSPAQTATKPLSLSVAMSIWSNTAAPTLVDAGPDSPVALGVKFRSDVAGAIAGIRFYKADANTGAHVGNLWTSDGTLLATVTFSNETASGWQQAFFAAPVAIASNTVYVASYHANNGHYSEDDYYFDGKGMDNPPLHAPADEVVDGNGVYAYGSSSAFPNRTWRAANYWVDVVFLAGSSPTLTSIVVTAANPSISIGASQQFTATGTYSDGSTQDVTSQARWTSSNTGVATIDAGGLATGISSGVTTISATLSGVVGATTLTVTAPLIITTTSLPAGALNVAYTGTLTAAHGTLPYLWSISNGSLPSGLTLNPGSGLISGTPTASGIFRFTAQVRDSSSPAQTASQPLSISVAMSIWSNTAAPERVDAGPASPVELGVKFRSDVTGTIAGIRFYKADANTGVHVGNLWTSNGMLLATVTFSNETASGWQEALFTTPVTIASDTVYVASYHANNGHYSADEYYFRFLTKYVDNPPLHALADDIAGPNGVYAYGESSVFPDQSWHAANYWVDVVFQPASPPPLTSIPLMAAGGNVERWPWVWTSGDFSKECGASNLIDGDTNTMWIGNVGDGPWRVILDLGAVTDVTGIQLMFQDIPWTNQELIGSRDSEVWFDYLAETNEWVPLRYLYIDFLGNEPGAQPPAIREIIWRER